MVQLACIVSLLWHKAYPQESITAGCILVKSVKETKFGSVCHQLSSPFSKGTSFSCMLLPGPFRTTTNFNLSVSIGPTSVSLYKWTLSSTPSVCAKHQIDTLLSYRNIYHQSLSGSLKDHLSDQDARGSTQREVSGDGLESSRQSCHLEAVQTMDGGDLRGRPGCRGQTVGPHTCGRRR